MTIEGMQNIVAKPLAVFAQRGGTMLFLSETGAVAVNAEGKVVTTYGAKEFTEFMYEKRSVNFCRGALKRNWSGRCPIVSQLIFPRIRSSDPAHAPACDR